MLQSLLLVHAQMPLRGKKHGTRALNMERKGKRAITYKPRAKTKTGATTKKNWVKRKHACSFIWKDEYAIFLVN